MTPKAMVYIGLYYALKNQATKSVVSADRQSVVKDACTNLYIQAWRHVERLPPADDFYLQNIRPCIELAVNPIFSEKERQENKKSIPESGRLDNEHHALLMEAIGSSLADFAVCEPSVLLSAYCALRNMVVEMPAFQQPDNAPTAAGEIAASIDLLGRLAQKTYPDLIVTRIMTPPELTCHRPLAPSNYTPAALRR